MCVYVYVYVIQYTPLHSNYRAGYCMLLSLALYFDNAPSLTLASFLCTESTRPPGIGKTVLARPSSELVAGQQHSPKPTACVVGTSVSASGADSD